MMRRSAMAGIGGGLLLLGGAGCSVEQATQTKTETETRYATGEDSLSLRCVSASSGRCSIRLDETTKAETIDLAVGESRTLRPVPPGARYCLVVHPEGDCELRPVGQPL